MIRYLALSLFLLSACKTAPIVKQTKPAKDHFFIFGGGYSAIGNQVSLEKNIDYMNSILNVRPPQSKYILFADGNKRERSLQYRINDGFPDNFQEVLIFCLGTTKRINDYYRPHNVVNQGALKKLEIEKYFREKGSELKKDERLFVYYTGHGGKGDKKDPQNTGLYLWHDGIYRMKEFSSRLQSLPPETPVVCVMVQCFSGGFQNIIFKDGDPQKGFAENNICGFYATVHDRMAAGCTPEINEADYQEYSTWFWAALSGKNRLGFKILKPDYDGDRKTSFDEAHAYTLINLRSIDIPV
ncbi:MAG: caspase family protein, partial [Lentisphaeraceae bacterium]|nr:caspase family protein [Lentisphaeraceae bacterium]